MKHPKTSMVKSQWCKIHRLLYVDWEPKENSCWLKKKKAGLVFPTMLFYRLQSFWENVLWSFLATLYSKKWRMLRKEETTVKHGGSLVMVWAALWNFVRGRGLAAIKTQKNHSAARYATECQKCWFGLLFQQDNEPKDNQIHPEPWSTTSVGGAKTFHLEKTSFKPEALRS